MASKLELSKGTADGNDTLLDDSLITFGVDQTDAYFESLRECLNLQSNNPQMGTTVE